MTRPDIESILARAEAAPTFVLTSDPPGWRVVFHPPYLARNDCGEAEAILNDRPDLSALARYALELEAEVAVWHDERDGGWCKCETCAAVRARTKP